MRHVLLYGTLRARAKPHRALGLPAALAYLGERRITGTLYDLGDYPALVLGRGTTIAELYRIRDGAILARMDAFERFDPRDPGRSLFLRTTTQVARFGRSRCARLAAWVYVFNGPVSGRDEIPGGSWSRRRSPRA